MDFFSSWLTNIVFISVTVTLLNLVLPDTMGKYVKVITGFIIMLVIVQPVTHMLNADIYFDDLYLKHTSIMENNVVAPGSEKLSLDQENLTVKVYQQKLTKSIEKAIEESLKIKVKLNVEINEDMSKENFGTLKKAQINILEEDIDHGLNINIKKIDLGDKDPQTENTVSEKSKDKINNFFLNFYKLEAENITISKNE